MWRLKSNLTKHISTKFFYAHELQQLDKLSHVTILLICSLNHYWHHPSRGACVKSVCWYLRRCNVQGEKLHKLVARISILMIEYSTWWFSGLYSFFPCVSFFLYFSHEFSTRQFVQYKNVYYALCLQFFPLGFFGVVRHRYTDNYLRVSVGKLGPPMVWRWRSTQGASPNPSRFHILLSFYAVGSTFRTL